MGAFSGHAASPAVVALGSCTGALRAPSRVAVDSAGNIYVSDPASGVIAIFDSWCRRVGTRGGFAGPLAVAVDGQNRIYIGEERTGSVSVFDPQWNLLYKLGAGSGEFVLPGYIAVAEGPSETQAWVSDGKRNTIKVYTGPSAAFEFGGTGTGNGQFDFPAGLCLSDSGEVFVVDQNNDRVQVFDRSGNFLRAFPLGSSTPSGRAQAIVLDHAGRLYAADTFQGAVKVFDAATGTALGLLGNFGQLPGELRSPAGLALDGWNRLFVASTGNGRIELYGIDSFLHTRVVPASGPIATDSTLVLEAVTGPGAVSFRWQKDGTDVTGADQSLLTIDQVSLVTAGSYSLVVSGTFGTLSSGAVQIEVLVPPEITQPPLAQKVLRGSVASLEVHATGSSLAYQWLHNGFEVPGANGPMLVLPDVQAFQAGNYSVMVSNSVGVVVSAPAALEVIVPPEIVEVVSSAMATDGFHLLLNGDPGFSYWLEAGTNLFNWEPLAELRLDQGLEEVVDFAATNLPSRFYRLRWAP